MWKDDKLIVLVARCAYKKVSIDYANIIQHDRYAILLDIFENRQLKQAMEYVNAQVILSTVHGAKGLEWDYIILADVEQRVMTFLCDNCPSSNTVTHPTACRLPHYIPENMMKPLLDDLCVFYVGITRAKKQAYVSASAERFFRDQQFVNGKMCCLAFISGIKLVSDELFVA